MKILLIYPYFLEERLNAEEIAAVPIGLYYIGAFLKERGHDIEILNWHNVDKESGLIEKALKHKRPDMIGLSVFHANRWGAVDIARIAKKLDPKVKVVFGGPGATFLWEHFLTHFPEIDFVVPGEGERSFAALVDAVGQGHPAAGIKGIAYRASAKPVRTEDPPPIENPDELPDPARYFTFEHVASSRGCPWNCTFCGSPRFWGRKVRFHSPAYFVDQLERLYRKGVTFFFFSDDTFALKEARVIEICRRIIEKGLNITWVAISRVENVSEDMFYWMRKAGCIQISYGIESGSEEIRALLNKNLDARQIRRAFALTQRYGILARAYFIYGCPRETDETIRETLDLIGEIRPLSIIFYILDIFPGTALYREFQERTGASDDIWLKKMEDIMYWETDPDLSREQVLAFGEKLRAGFYENLPRFAEALDLVGRVDLYPHHADFLSRLAMTFTHGDYAGIDAIPDKAKTASALHKHALRYHPEHRAFMGFGILMQQAGDYEGSVGVLLDGIRAHPRSEALHICLAISLMNLGRYREALDHLMRFPRSAQAAGLKETCHRALNAAGTPTATE
ncbi:MAG: cobalamin-dependent protein [Deltaproteobacteria bacterium]|nr:cobalamin-dependent protein [Deltaproteobacteria bacterium]